MATGKYIMLIPPAAGPQNLQKVRTELENMRAENPAAALGHFLNDGLVKAPEAADVWRRFALAGCGPTSQELLRVVLAAGRSDARRLPVDKI